MPTYAYVCRDCGHNFEQWQTITDDALSQCPVCFGVLRKKFNNVAVSFKGDGFYRNDARKSSSASTSASPSSSSSSSSSE